MADFPDIKIDSELDDTQGFELNIFKLYDKFISPIEGMRSFSAAPSIDRPVIADGDFVSNDAANAAESDPTQPQESRTHAFYRMIGFPVVNDAGAFYNPGYDPLVKADERVKTYNISSSISDPVKLAHSLRETDVRTRLSIFSRRAVDASVYAVAMGVPQGVKPFLQMDDTEGFDAITSLDEQKFSVPDRKKYIESRYERRDGQPITNFFQGGTHILRPFNVDPNIVDSVTGLPNETRHVAVPFLPLKRDTAIDRDIFTKRPAIEFILRLRLTSQPDNGLIGLILGGTEETLRGEFTNSEVSEVVSALLDQDGADISNADIINRLKNASEIELINLNKLVKTIKGVVGLLADSIDEISEVSKKINWKPLPLATGPERGSDITPLLKTLQQTELEKRILNLSIRADEGKRQGTLSNTNAFASEEFHLSGYENVEKTWDRELQEEKEQRDNQQRIGSNALSSVEIITGEISGLGLIDILAIYTALWAIDIEVLISMLDERAFNRMRNFNPDLKTAAENSTRISINEAMQTFERQVINILSYADRILQQKLGSPVNSEGGNVPRVEL